MELGTGNLELGICWASHQFRITNSEFLDYRYFCKKDSMLTAVRIYKYVLLCVLVAITGSSLAQSPASIHIQSELPKQYSVQWNGNNYNSTDRGYLEIPQVPAGEQLLILGFPGNAYPETAFTFTITDKPRGFALKLGIDNSWSMFDMVDFLAMRGVPAAGLKIDKPVPPVVAIPPPVKKQDQKASSIRKLFDKAGPDGIDQVYLIDNNGKTDTIALFIPVLEEIKPKQSASASPSVKPNSNTGLADMLSVQPFALPKPISIRARRGIFTWNDQRCDIS
jgi:hypothetical protein